MSNNLAPDVYVAGSFVLDLGVSRIDDAPCTYVTEATWTDVRGAAEAARWCERCPLIEACLLAAMRADAALRTGADSIGVTGIFGGVWFSPDFLPRRLYRTGVAPAGPRQRRVHHHHAA